LSLSFDAYVSEHKFENGRLFEIEPRLKLVRTEEQQRSDCALADNKVSFVRFVSQKGNYVSAEP